MKGNIKGYLFGAMAAAFFAAPPGNDILSRKIKVFKKKFCI